MDQEKFVNVTVAQPARMPLRPVPRDLFKRFLAAMVAGVLGGFGIVFSLEQFLFRSFTTGDEIERKLGIPHISSIPDSSQAG
jgi:capsular polysaccharide biosynthesis protein